MSKYHVSKVQCSPYFYQHKDAIVLKTILTSRTAFRSVCWFYLDYLYQAVVEDKWGIQRCFHDFIDSLISFLHHQRGKHPWEPNKSSLCPLKIVLMREQSVSQYGAWLPGYCNVCVAWRLDYFNSSRLLKSFPACNEWLSSGDKLLHPWIVANSFSCISLHTVNIFEITRQSYNVKVMNVQLPKVVMPLDTKIICGNYLCPLCP